MTRKPALSLHEQLWRGITSFGEGSFTIRDLHGRFGGMTIDSLRHAVLALERRGLVRCEAEAPTRVTGGKIKPTKLYVCTRPKAPYIPPPQEAASETRQQKLWRAMRNLREWSVPELAATATTEEVPVDVDCAAAYVSTLVSAHVVQTVKPRVSDIGAGSIAATYRLAPSANSGPLAPQVRRGRRVYDLNLRRLVGDAQAEQVSA